eukprot:5482116-Heterocapsa_arctica.AAC.1
MGASSAAWVADGGTSGGCRLAWGWALGRSLELHPPPMACSTRTMRVGDAPLKAARAWAPAGM